MSSHLSVESVVAIVALFVSLPPAVLAIARCIRRRRQSRRASSSDPETHELELQRFPTNWHGPSTSHSSHPFPSIVHSTPSRPQTWGYFEERQILYNQAMIISPAPFHIPS
ncbi:hypothetical protein GGR57DRAFT_435252 [Xylariaceae sp. FL1272]|nr:hypothetical protein GGR57DRAFT_435252 [Xylariaceae sp. FL1272]